ncbi:MAG: AcrR family transcriptional regulator [Candidatus Binatia bacterium]|jgi:AcrR family transcriptional regulator
MQTSTLKRPTRPDRRQAILKAAATTFCELGFERATVSDILRGTGIRSTGFYNYFADKDQVLIELIEDVTEPLVRRLTNVRSEVPLIEARVLRLCEVYFAFVADSRVLRALLRHDGGKVRTLACEAMVRAAVEGLDEDLRVAAEAGMVASVDPEYLNAVVFGVMFQLGVRMLERTPCESEDVARFASVVILGGLDRLTEKAEPGGLAYLGAGA